MPPLLLAEVAQAINESDAMLVFICNLVAENGPASQLSLHNQWRWLESRVGAGRVDAILALAGEYPAELAGRLIRPSCRPPHRPRAGKRPSPPPRPPQAASGTRQRDPEQDGERDMAG
jgi:hypothetical protein